jgi:predicted metal-dependent phosphoesterase TrpH
MPARQPFTSLCQAAARPRNAGRVDLHVHTVHSDGLYTPAQVVELARRSGLAAVAITDHDTLDGIGPAQLAAAGQGVEVVTGVEITAEYRQREIHILGYFVRADDDALSQALDRLRTRRIERFSAMAERLRSFGLSLDEKRLTAQAAAGTVGRRHLAQMLVDTRQAGSVREVFQRFLGDRGRAVVPKQRLPVADALDLVRGAGGVASWAHPSYDCTAESLLELRRLGLSAVEAEYPSHRGSRTRELRKLAGNFGLAITGGSDCHGPEPLNRAIGSTTISAGELQTLRNRICREVCDGVS